MAETQSAIGPSADFYVLMNGVPAGAVYPYGSVVWDMCKSTLCFHNGVTPGGTCCVSIVGDLCTQMRGLPDLVDNCPSIPPPNFNLCAAMMALPDISPGCTVAPNPQYDLCDAIAAMPDLSSPCPPTVVTPFDLCALQATLPDLTDNCP